MKLTLAMGLQFDNNKAANMYALSVGGDKQAVVPHEPVMDVSLQSDQPLALIEHPSDTPFFLTYNLNGLPDTLMFDTQLDVFV